MTIAGREHGRQQLPCGQRASEFGDHQGPAIQAAKPADDDEECQPAAITGAACIDWCGHTAGPGYSVAGNMLAGPQVIEATAAAYEAHAALPFAERLLLALAAGEAAGGDKRGKQAAALLTYTTEDYCALDIRVDDHVEPIEELKRLYAKSLERFQPFSTCLPSKARPAGITDRSIIEAEIERFHTALHADSQGVAA